MKLIKILLPLILIAITIYAWSMTQESANNAGLFLVLCVALAGGFILNFMPCVLPVISLKALSVIKIGKSDSTNIRKNFLASAAGIITTFYVLGVAIAILRMLGHYAGLGLHFQQPYFIVTVILILTAFTVYLSGDLSVNLPNWLNSVLGAREKAKGVFGSFISGILATILATPCTAPLVGSAISFAITKDPWVIILIFSVIGIGMAMPFLVLAIYTNSYKLIPRPGAWVNMVKKAFEILIYFTILWLIYILYGLIGLKAALLVLLISLLLKFILINSTWILAKKTVKLILVLLVIFAAYYLPYQHNINQAHHNTKINQVWQEFSFESLDKGLSQGKIVIVDITADWCVTCKYNKFTVLNTDYVMNLLNDKDIITLRGDYTAANKELNRFLAIHNRYAIPLTVIYSKNHPKGLILPPILTVSKFVDAVSKAKSE